MRGGIIAVTAPKLGPEATVIERTVFELNALKRSAVSSSRRCPPTEKRFDARQFNEFWLSRRRAPYGSSGTVIVLEFGMVRKIFVRRNVVPLRCWKKALV